MKLGFLSQQLYIFLMNPKVYVKNIMLIRKCSIIFQVEQVQFIKDLLFYEQTELANQAGYRFLVSQSEITYV